MAFKGLREEVRKSMHENQYENPVAVKDGLHNLIEIFYKCYFNTLLTAQYLLDPPTLPFKPKVRHVDLMTY